MLLSAHLATGSHAVYHRAMRRLTIAILLVMLGAAPARADVGIGFFLGDPTGLDLKIDLQRRSSLDIVLGIYDFREGKEAGYAHFTYLVTPVYARGRSVNVPLRVGIGAAVFGFRSDVHAGVRVPFELGLAFKTTPLEIYFEIGALLALIGEDPRFDLQGGVGLRFYL